LVGITQPRNGSDTQRCVNGPFNGPGFANGVYEVVAQSYNASVIQQASFSNPAGSWTQSGGTLNNGGAFSAYPSGDTANYSVDSSCFITVPRQTDTQSNVFERSLGAVSPDGSVFALADFDTSGGGPQFAVGVRISNVLQMQ